MDINVILKFLPDAASSPAAFSGYVVVVVAWLVLALRVRRNKNLLDSLEKLPAKQRLPALIAEMGGVAPPDGITPRDWLKSRIHTYYFLAFLVLCFCLTLLALVAYFSASAAPAKTAAAELSLYVDEQGKRGASEPSEYLLQYVAHNPSGRTLDVRATMPYLSALDAGKEVRGIRYLYDPFEWEYPRFSVKVVNNSQSTILISEIQFDVVKSTIDVSPVPVIRESDYNVGHILFFNAGWGSMKNPVLRVVGWSNSCNDDSQLLGNEVSVTLPDIKNRTNVEVAKFVPIALQNNEWVCAFGTLSYSGEDSRPIKPFRFRTLVSLVRPMAGAPAPPTALYDLFLRAGEVGYTASVPVSHEVKSGATEHFLIRIGTDKSAKFNLRFRAKALHDIVFREQDVQLFIFVPSNARAQRNAASFTELPRTAWEGISQSKFIKKIMYDPEYQSAIQVFVTGTSKDFIRPLDNFVFDSFNSDHHPWCKELGDELYSMLKNGPVKTKLGLVLIDSKGEKFCRHHPR